MKKIFLLIFVGLSVNITAQKRILTEVKTLGQPMSKSSSDSNIINQFLVKLEIDSLSNEDYVFSIEGKQYNLINGDYKNTSSGYSIWNSDISDSNQISSYFIEIEGKIWGDIISKNLVYELKPLNNDDYILTMSVYDPPKESCTVHSDTTIIGEKKHNNTNSTKSSTTCDYEIYRMIIAYTPEVTAYYTNQAELNTFLINIVNYTNKSYKNSDLNVRVRLAFAYETPDSETGDRDDDFEDFAYENEKFEEIFDLIDEYNADIATLIVSGNVGGVTNLNTNSVLSGRIGASWDFIVAHEVGHLFGLEHDRDSYNFVQRLLLDPKKAYGFKGSRYSTVMATQDINLTHRPYYSDENIEFQDHETAGDEYSHAKIYLAEHTDNVIVNSDLEDIHENNKVIQSDEMVSLYATSSLQATDYVCYDDSYVIFKAGDSILLNAGFKINLGAKFIATISSCDEAIGF